MPIGLGLTATEGGVQLSTGYTNLYSQILAETNSAVFHAIIYSELAPLVKYVDRVNNSCNKSGELIEDIATAGEYTTTVIR